MYGFQREIIAATQPVEGCLFAYVESKARQSRDANVEVTFHLFVRSPDGSIHGSELESHNPYFGCEIGYLEWCGELVVLIYREKHRTYVCRIGTAGPAVFVAIGDNWVVEGKIVTHRAGEGAPTQRLKLPELDELPPLPADAVT